MSKNKPNKRPNSQPQAIRHAPPPTPRLAPENGVSGHPGNDAPLTLTPEGLQRLERARAELAQRLEALVGQMEKIKRDGDAEIARLTQQARQLEAMIHQQDGGIQTMQLLLSGLPENRVEVDRTPMPGHAGLDYSPGSGNVEPVRSNGNGAYDDLAKGPEDFGALGF